MKITKVQNKKTIKNMFSITYMKIPFIDVYLFGMKCMNVNKCVHFLISLYTYAIFIYLVLVCLLYLWSRATVASCCRLWFSLRVRTLAESCKTDSHSASHQCNGSLVTAGCVDASMCMSTKSPPAGPDVSWIDASVSPSILRCCTWYRCHFVPFPCTLILPIDNSYRDVKCFPFILKCAEYK